MPDWKFRYFCNGHSYEKVHLAQPNACHHTSKQNKKWKAKFMKNNTLRSDKSRMHILVGLGYPMREKNACPHESGTQFLELQRCCQEKCVQ